VGLWFTGKGLGLGGGAPAIAVAHVLSASLGLQSLGPSTVAPPAACAIGVACIAVASHSTYFIRPLEADMS
jgi:hypothetical protein